MTTPKMAIDANARIEIITILNRLGISANLKGYEYLKCALAECLENPDLSGEITKRLYPSIAKQCGTTGSRVERAIRHSIEVMFDNQLANEVDTELWGSVSADKGKPTNSQFIAVIAERLRVNLGLYDMYEE